MVRAFISALLLCALQSHPGEAHPAWGIVVDPQGRVVYSEVDSNVIWRVEGGRPVPILRGKHSHEIYTDGEGNLFGEHVRYEPAGERWILSLWQLTPDGREIPLLPPTPTVDLPPGVGPLRDRQGNTYAFRDAFQGVEETVLYRRTPAGEAILLAGGARGHADGQGRAARFTGARGKAFGPDGSLYLADGTAVRRVTPDGQVTTLGGNPLGRGSYGDKPALFGLAVDGAGKVLVAVFDQRRVLEVTPDGRIRERWQSDPLWAPTGVATAGGALYVLETPSLPLPAGRTGPAVRIWRLDPNGSKERLVASGEWRGRVVTGVGVGIVLIAIAILGFWLWRRARRLDPSSPRPSSPTALPSAGRRGRR